MKFPLGGKRQTGDHAGDSGQTKTNFDENIWPEHVGMDITLNRNLYYTHIDICVAFAFISRCIIMYITVSKIN